MLNFIRKITLATACLSLPLFMWAAQDNISPRQIPQQGADTSEWFLGIDSGFSSNGPTELQSSIPLGLSLGYHFVLQKDLYVELLLQPRLDGTYNNDSALDTSESAALSSIELAGIIGYHLMPKFSLFAQLGIMGSYISTSVTIPSGSESASSFFTRASIGAGLQYAITNKLAGYLLTKFIFESHPNFTLNGYTSAGYVPATFIVGIGIKYYF